jgi:hypothetical protein
MYYPLATLEPRNERGPDSGIAGWTRPARATVASLHALSGLAPWQVRVVLAYPFFIVADITRHQVSPPPIALVDGLCAQISSAGSSAGLTRATGPHGAESFRRNGEAAEVLRTCRRTGL